MVIRFAVTGESYGTDRISGGRLNSTSCEKATANRGVPINAILELTPLCNMNCDMCFVRLSAGEMKQKGRLRSAEEWIGLGRDMKGSGGLCFVLFTGGESHCCIRSLRKSMLLISGWG